MNLQNPTHVNDFTKFPDASGHFGVHGGRFVSETLMMALEELERIYMTAKADPQFWQEFQEDLVNYVGRPTPLYFAKRLTAETGGAKIYLKREDLNHTGAHKVNNTIGQALLAKMVGKKRVIAETGAGQHGVATATIAARLGLECVVYMGGGRCRTPKNERVSYATTWGDCRACNVWLSHAQRCDERGDARLGNQCGQHLLCDWHGGRPAPLSNAGA